MINSLDGFDQSKHFQQFPDHTALQLWVSLNGFPHKHQHILRCALVTVGEEIQKLREKETFT